MQDDRVDLWATDEVHFQQHGSRCRMWIPPESRTQFSCTLPPARLWAISGPYVCEMGVLCSVWKPANSMDPVSCNFSSNSAPPVAGRGDGFWSLPTMPGITTPALHRPWREQHAHHFALDFLPPYSPELNPIERVWKLARRRCLHNRYFDKLQDVIRAVESEFATWTTATMPSADYAQVLKTLCLAHPRRVGCYQRHLHRAG
jgi:hypothetical protein